MLEMNKNISDATGEMDFMSKLAAPKFGITGMKDARVTVSLLFILFLIQKKIF